MLLIWSYNYVKENISLNCNLFPYSLIEFFPLFSIIMVVNRVLTSQKISTL